MPVEIEAKMKLDDPPAMAALLERLGATRIGRYLETNAFYDTSDGTLLARKEGLRIRVSRNMDNGEVRCVLTHKGPKQPGPLKVREETELTVADADAADRMLARLGFLCRICFEKHRDSWTLGNCHIELDEVPHLGHFIEIEGPDESSIQRVRATLGLAELPLIKTSYIGLLSRHLQESGQSVTEITFPPRRG